MMFKARMNVDVSKISLTLSKKIVKRTNWKNVSSQFRDHVVSTVRDKKKNPYDRKPLEKLEASTRKYRKRIAKQNPLHPSTSTRNSKSNLPLSGQYLDSILSSFTRMKDRVLISFYIDPRKEHKGYKGHNRKKKKMMTDVARGLSQLKNYDLFQGIDEEQKSYLITRILKPLIRGKKK